MRRGGCGSGGGRLAMQDEQGTPVTQGYLGLAMQGAERLGCTCLRRLPSFTVNGDIFKRVRTVHEGRAAPLGAAATACLPSLAGAALPPVNWQP